MRIKVNWYGIKEFITKGENLNNGWWYILMDGEYHHIEEKYVSIVQNNVERIKKMRKFENGATVFVNSIWNKKEECIVIGYIENESSTCQNVYKVQSQVNGGTFGATEDCVFATLEEAHFANIKKSNDLINKYKAEIKDINDLLRFPLEHCFNGEEYTEYEAMEAYKIRTNELTDIVL